MKGCASPRQSALTANEKKHVSSDSSGVHLSESREFSGRARFVQDGAAVVFSSLIHPAIASFLHRLRSTKQETTGAKTSQDRNNTIHGARAQHVHLRARKHPGAASSLRFKNCMVSFLTLRQLSSKISNSLTRGRRVAASNKERTLQV